MIPLIVLTAVALYGTAKGVSGVMDSNKASDTNSTAESIVSSASERVKAARENTNKVLEDYGSRKLRAFNGVIEDFLNTFGRLKNVEIGQTPVLESLQLGDFPTEVLQGLHSDYQLLKSSGLGLGAGMTGGAAAAFGAYNGTMLLASASTGTAISTLSGAAATNATLAWLGGGTIAAGGGGVAMGTMVLGGLVATPALLIFGFYLSSKGSEALANAQSNLESAKTFRAEMDKAIEQLRAMEGITSLANNAFSKVSGRLRHAVHDLRNVIDVHGENYQSYATESREAVFRAVKFAQLLKAMIDTPILDEEGNLVLSTKKRVSDIVAMAEGKEAASA